MAEGNNNHASHGGRSYGGRKPGSGRPGNRGGKGFKPRGNGGKSYGDKGFRPRRHDDNGGYRRHDDARHGAGDGERRFHRDAAVGDALHHARHLQRRHQQRALPKREICQGARLFQFL